mmetsp:Transcript_16058/g.22158  ORF Transcript_16058/g.22158 Transcript_16058/m.22158 type:complete len:243 (-) Transcript_16058:143-871(-)|eukprot:CAMPEP_0196594864 /NCGR_PEP_ID=MMETSP1081-20130531/79475_1 /TAXON_ID=36882 /ORGANISM="Pyramimonas amylifera, Strain CCMP720" /LENGTH=242 /DNA_ID=CAMNT_0041919239 /DNA_START=111 /DNA_END=839 /DNA_ORIENTATION=-
MQTVASRTFVPSSSRCLSGSSGSSLGQASFSGKPNSARNLRLVVLDAVKKRSGRTIVKTATLVASPKQADKVRKLCNDLVDFAHIEMKTGTKSGIESFECQEDSHEPGTFHFWERYSSNAFMANFNSNAEMQIFTTKVRPMLEGPIGMSLYEYSNGQLGAAACPVGPTGEGGLEDAPGGNAGSGGGASLQQTSSTLDLGNLTRGDEGDSFGMKENLREASQVVEEAVENAKKLFDGLLGKKK